MYAFFLLSLFFLPIIYAEQYQAELNDNDDMFMLRSVAANYLFDRAVRQNENRASLSLLMPSSDGTDLRQPQRAKRIYWENLAFHATDYNQKVKKF